MKRTDFMKSFITPLFALLFILSGCSNNLEENTASSSTNTSTSAGQTCVIIDSVNIADNSRTIQPVISKTLNKMSSIYLRGSKDNPNSLSTLANGNNISQIFAKQILLDAGTWTFDLEGYLSGVYYHERKENVVIQEAQANLLSFSLSPCAKSGSTYSPFEYGGVDITVYFPGTDIGKLTVKLIDLSTGTVIGEKSQQGYLMYSWGSSQNPSIPVPTGYKYFSYNRNINSTSGDTARLSPGDYRITYDFYTQAGSTLLNQVWYDIHVVNGLTSTHEEVLALNKGYKITVVKNDSSIESGNEIPGYYSRVSDTITLPTMKRSNHRFRGWYTTSTFDEGTDITEIPKGSTGDKSIYACLAQIYKITYNLNGSTDAPVTNNPSNPAEFTRYELPITFEDPTRDGYSFDGWYTFSDFRDTSRITGITESDTLSNKTIYAKWTN